MVEKNPGQWEVVGGKPGKTKSSKSAASKNGSIKNGSVKNGSATFNPNTVKVEELGKIEHWTAIY